jgi:glycosyltransferase involved in cell wall biosynthesis
MSNVVLEAMASGLPVVGTRTGGLQEQIEDGTTGVLVAPGDSEALAIAILALVRDQKRRAAMGSAGRVRAVGRYSVDSVVDAYEELYARLVQERSGQPFPSSHSD